MRHSRPSASVVLVPLHDDELAWQQHLHITTLWIVRIDDRAIPAVTVLIRRTLDLRMLNAIGVTESTPVLARIAGLRSTIGIAKHSRIRSAIAFGQDENVMAVHMHRMRLVAGVLHDKAQTLVAAVVVRVLDVWEVDVAELRLQKNRIVVVNAECAIRHVPQQISAIGSELQRHDLCD